VLRDDGVLLLGMVFADTPWGEFYRRQADRGHAFYSAARFLTRAQVAGLLSGAGLRLVAACSTLVQPPSEQPHPEPVHDADDPNAGFVAWQAVPTRGP
jgi:hypothetical protein